MSEKGHLGTHWGWWYKSKFAAQMKARKELSETFICDGWIHLPDVTTLFMEQFVNLDSEESTKGYSVHREAYGEKGNTVRWKLERSFLTDCFELGGSISQSWIFLFIEQFGNTVFVESAMGYFGAHKGLRWKKKILPVKIGEKLSEKILFNLGIHLIELNVSVEGALWPHCFYGVWDGIFGNTLKPMV